MSSVFLLPARMRTADHLHEVGDLDVGVALGGLERGVAQEDLDVADVGASLEQVFAKDEHRGGYDEAGMERVMLRKRS